MKKYFALILALLLLASLCACGSGESITFKNDNLIAVQGVYISSINQEEWGDPMNYSVIKKDASISISFDKFAGNGAEYDIGVLDDQDMLFEFYGVPLAVGDTVAFSAAGKFGTLTVTGSDGSVDTYKGQGEEAQYEDN